MFLVATPDGAPTGILGFRPRISMFLVATPEGAPTGILGLRSRISMFLVATPDGVATEAFGLGPKAPCVAALPAHFSIHAECFCP
ncbi:MAG: hypothetical protein ACI82F_003065 [Planctomycetota bacterium]|jgi:hypothetical protein